MDDPNSSRSTGGTVLITGAAGFIGSHLARFFLARGVEVHGLVRRRTRLDRLADLGARLPLHFADLRNPADVETAWRAAAPDQVIHAGIYGVHPERRESGEMLETNVFGTRALLDCARRFGVRRLVILGGSSEYGPSDVPLVEDQLPEPPSLYGTSKAMATLLSGHAARQHGVPVLNLRLFSVYGPWEPDHRLIPTALDCALSGRPLALTGPGLRRDFVFVADVCGAVWRACQVTGLHGEIINVGSGRQYANEEVAAIIDRLTDGGLEVRPGTYPAHTGDRGHWVADIAKAERLLRWRPSTSLECGLRQTLEWRSRRGVQG